MPKSLALKSIAFTLVQQAYIISLSFSKNSSLETNTICVKIK